MDPRNFAARSTSAPESQARRRRSPFRPLLGQLRRLLRAADGMSAVEFGLAAPILMAILSPVVELGQAFHQQMEVQNAAQAGAQYALRHGWDSASIQNAASAATPVAITTSSSEGCYCPTASGMGAAVTCQSSCADGTSAGTYVTVDTQSTYTSTLPYSLLGSSATLSAQAAVRIW